MEQKNLNKIILNNINTDVDDYDKEFEEFLSIDSIMKNPIPTSFTVLPSGCRIVNEFHTVKHIYEPELTLPTLKERASRSKMKDLYNISKQLMASDNEENESSSEFETSLNEPKSSDQVQIGYTKDVIKNKGTLEMQEEKQALVKKPTHDPNFLSNRSSGDLENAKELDQKSLGSDTSSIAAMKNFRLPTATELLTAKRNLKVPRRQNPEQTTHWGLYKKFYLYKKPKHKATQTLLDSQNANAMWVNFYKSIYNCRKYDKWLWFSFLLLLCTSVYIFYITRFDICAWHTKKTVYDSLKTDCNFIMNWYYSLRIWLLKP